MGETIGEEQIRSWVRAGLVSEEQASKLLATLPDRERSSALTGSVSSGVLFAAGALNGLVIWLFSLVHAVNAAAHTIVLLWIVSLAPIAYVLRQTAFTVLFCLTCFLWVGLFVYGNMPVVEAVDRLVFLPVTYLAAGVALFSFGGTHDIHPGLRPIARTYRLAGLQAAALSLFALGLDTFGGRPARIGDWRRLEASNRFLIALLAICAGGAVFTLVNWRLGPRLKAVTREETPVCLAMLALVVLYALVPIPGIAYVALFNVVLLAMSLVALATGIRRHDPRLLDIGALGLGGLVIARYIDFAWGRLETASFFTGLGVLGAVCAAALFARRRFATRGAGATAPAPAPAAAASPLPPPAPGPADPLAALDPELRTLLDEVRPGPGAGG